MAYSKRSIDMATLAISNDAHWQQGVTSETLMQGKGKVTPVKIKENSCHYQLEYNCYQNIWDIKYQVGQKISLDKNWQ